MENKNEVISSKILFYDQDELELKPNQNESNSPFSNQKNYGHSIKDDPLVKIKSEWFKNQGFTKKKFQELAKTTPTKLKELFVDLQLELEIHQLLNPSSSVENYKLLKSFYLEIIKQVRDDILKSESTSRKSKLCKYLYQFSDLQAPYPKTLKLKTKSGEVKETEFPKKYFMMRTDNYFDKRKEKWIKKPLILLNQTKLQRKDIIIEKSWKLNMKEFDLEVKKNWDEFLVERAKFEKIENSSFSNYFLINLLNAFTTSESSNKGSIQVVKVWDIVYDSVLRTWIFFMEKEYYQEFREDALDKKQPVRGFASYKKTISVKNLSKEWINQADLLCQDEMDCQDESECPDFFTYLQLSLDEVASLKEEKIKKFGKQAALRERLYLVSEPLLTALISSNLLIFESREERNKKNFEQGEFLTLEEVQSLKYNTLLLNLNLNDLNQSFFKETFF